MSEDTNPYENISAEEKQTIDSAYECSCNAEHLSILNRPTIAMMLSDITAMIPKPIETEEAI